MAPTESPIDGILAEIDLLSPIRVRADHLIDTSETVSYTHLDVYKRQE